MKRKYSFDEMAFQGKPRNYCRPKKSILKCTAIIFSLFMLAVNVFIVSKHKENDVQQHDRSRLNFVEKFQVLEKYKVNRLSSKLYTYSFVMGRFHENRSLYKEEHLDIVEGSPLGYTPMSPEANTLPLTVDLVPLEDIPPKTYAYSFVIGGFHEDRKAYKGFLYNVLITVKILRRLGSLADFIVWAQLSPDSKREVLPSEDLRLFNALDIKVITMEKPTHESFAHLMYDKFRALQLTQYRRIIYLDSDVIPLVNFDYLFRLSDPQDESSPTILQPNIILASRNTPCNGGMFMMHPIEGSWEDLSEVIRRQHEEGRNLPYPHFDVFRGWGHNFAKAGDIWESVVSNQTNWNFHGAHSDQGLWYYYAKYVNKNVTIIIGDRVQSWTYNEQTKIPTKATEERGILDQYSLEPLVYQDDCDQSFDDSKFICFAPYRDLAHFTGKTKPWQVGVEKSWMEGTGGVALHAPHRLWFKELGELNQEHNFGLDMKKWNKKHMPSMADSPLGYMPLYKDNAKMIFGNNKSKNASMCNEFSGSLSSDENLEPMKEPTPKPYAYSFVIGGFHEDRVVYKGFLYNILISVKILKRLGSTADFIVWAQLSSDSTLNKLPPEDLVLFKVMGIHVIMMEKPLYPSITHLMYNKLQALQLTQYRRIIYLDSDTIPLVNLDYLFFLSDPADKTVPTIIQPNLIIASQVKPCDGGMIMMQPAEGAWEQLLEVVDRQRKEDKGEKNLRFDVENGWGHNFLEAGDKWETVTKNGHDWRFHGGYSDEGLWYYFAKYIRKDVSIIIGNRLQNWISNGMDEMPIKVIEQQNLFEKYSSEPIAYQEFCDTDLEENGNLKHICLSPYRDFAHFKRSNKPWLVGVEKSWYGGTGNSGLHAPHRLWFKELFELNDCYNIGIDIEHWENYVGTKRELPVGNSILSPSIKASNILPFDPSHMVSRIESKEKNV